MDSGEAMVVAGVDQDWAHCVEIYDRMSPRQRGLVAEFLIGREKDLPEGLEGFANCLAKTAFVETALRWAQKQ